MSRFLIDTSILIGSDDPGEIEGAISVASLAELHFGVSAAREEDERARRVTRLGVVEATFDPLPIDPAVAREWGRLSGAVLERGGKPRRRSIDLAIAATATVHGVPLMTADVDDLAIIADLVELKSPA